jgi:DNA replication initiation complex subunit (GINS family)
MTEDSKEVKVTYETLYELLRREKSKDELQKLDESFFRDVLDYLKEKTQMLQDTAGKFDMFSVEERETTQIQLNNIKKILKELYERREKKILEMALNKSKTNSNIIDTSNLLAKEHELYNVTVKTLDSFRKDILFSLLEMKAPVTAEFKEPEPPEPEPAPEPTPEPPEPGPEPIPEPDPASVKVKFLQKVEQFVGKELELYGPFEPETVAEVPKEIADILVNKGNASIIE